MSEQITQIVDDLNRAFEEFKSANDQRLAEIEKKGAADPVLEEKLAKIEKDIEAKQTAFDELKTELDRLNGALNRPTVLDAKGNPVDFDSQAKRFAEMKSADAGRRVEVSAEEYKAYEDAFEQYLRRDEKSLSPDEYKAISIGTGSAGGYLVLPEMYQSIIDYVIEWSPIRRFATLVSIGTDKLEVPTATGGIAGAWVGETAARPETATDTFGQVVITAHELYANPAVTARALEDTQFNVSDFLQMRVAEKFAELEGNAFIVGDGSDKPVGLLDAAGGLTPSVTSGSAGVFDVDDLIDVEAQLKSPYRPGAVWLMGRAAMAAARKLKDTNGQYLWQPAVAADQPSTMLGYQVVAAEDMPAVATGNAAVALVNLRRAYMVVDRHDVRVLRDPYSNKPFVHFYTVKRTGGAVVNNEAGVKLTIQ